MDDPRSKENSKDFTFAKLSDLNLPVTLRISQLEGIRKPRPYADLLENPELRFAGIQSEGLSDLYVTCQLVADNKPLTIQYRTAFKAFKNTYTWNEWISFPVKYCDLPLSAQITFTVWDIANPRTAVPVGGTTFKLFGKKWTLRRGKHRLLLWPGQEADGSIDSRTPSKVDVKDEMGRLEKLVKKYERDDIPKVDWLDTLTFRKMEEIHAAETEKSESLFLYVDLPRFDFPVIFSEVKDSIPAAPASTASTTAGPPPPTPVTPAPTPTTSTNTPATLNIHQDVHIWQIVDPDIARENPVEDKHRRLVRSHRSGPLDRELKPNAHDRDALTAILNYPPTRLLSADDKDLIWRFRFYLTREKKGLTKFLKSVTWKDPSEVKQAVEVLLPLWTDIGTDDALELLGPTTVDARVRRFAVKQLARSDDDELFLYLLQLVQALRFENVVTDTRTARGANPPPKEESALANFLIERGIRNLVLGNRLHWYLMVELDDKINGKMYGKVAYEFQKRLMEVEDGPHRRNLLKRQGELIATLSTKAKELRTSKDPRPKKIEKLRAFIADPKHNLAVMSPLPHPLNAKIEITGIIAEKSSVFKSNLFPLLLYFQCAPRGDGVPTEEYPVIFKNGDDLRQDQLVIQLFTLMDQLLRKENLDLKLSPYDVLATGPLEGMAQFIPSKTIAAIVSEHGTLLTYLRAHNADEGSVGTYGVKPSVIDTFVRSCAGYCVVTYILGVGDRHLDNLLLAPDGHFFHVDFGYILGRDPKPFPPPVKLCREMVDAMGGTSSPHYVRFKNLCFTAFTILRKSANLILNLVALMADANIPDIKHRDVHEQLQDKFRLDLTEEEAIKHFETLLNELSYLTVVFDRIHDLAQYWRS
ncbi:Phosphatidylinositol (PI) 3-kinase [Tulasnella sp. 403]|nr:Phosphatidylinositol (PI) 3-kinase [Tulasnella sp. 403]